jgi:hypothetical protein
VQAAYGTEKFARLRALKDRYDPTNLFHLNQNIPPSKAGEPKIGQSSADLSQLALEQALLGLANQQHALHRLLSGWSRDRAT